ncbi:hypothetical protein HPC49_01955 [Pyxidicoccus fallax]|uniref:DUF6484 domain-containing protein n=1 Tax=Pyxidicoccus fallax TaxID=394095 RepID=A0A848L5M5_9BACT|nr:DUF6484 domain-containing protein [Pyxidicoccus fallax]NMO13797.1 hypothetical protein [Pyxidicoccus fallax]NPC77016.1 hypothetical protein [Pyxidicoccus fallax]
MGSRETQPAQATDVLDEEEPILAPLVGQVVGVTEAGLLLVDFPGNRRGALPARTALELDVEARQRAVALRQEAVLLFERGEPALPLLVGLLPPPSETPLTDALLATSLPVASAEADLDGKRLVLEGREEVVLRCGKASLTLRHDGQVLLRGVNIRADAEEVHRIRGGKVQIN